MIRTSLMIDTLKQKFHKKNYLNYSSKSNQLYSHKTAVYRLDIVSRRLRVNAHAQSTCHFVGCVHIIFSFVRVAEWPPFGKELLTQFTLCSLCILTICDLSYFPFWF